MTDGRRRPSAGALRPAPSGLPPAAPAGDRPAGIDALTARFTPGRPVVVCYVPLGDPLLAPEPMLDAYADAGVDVLEVGIPCRDPWLDGSEVAGSMARALEAGFDAASIGRSIADWRRERVARHAALPAILWFGYPEVPLGAIVDAAEARSIDALLLIDPHRHEAGASLDARLAELGVARCAFLPWEPSAADLGSAARATGYVMVQARPGVTGAGGTAADPRPLVRRAREVAPGRPVVAGFGVDGPGGVTRVLAAGVDGVVVGSACIRTIRDGGAPGLRGFLGSLVAAARTTREGEA